MSNNFYINLNLLLIFAMIGVADVYAEALDIDRSVSAKDDLKLRIIVLTDIAPGETEPDDMEYDNRTCGGGSPSSLDISMGRRQHCRAGFVATEEIRRR